MAKKRSRAAKTPAYDRNAKLEEVMTGTTAFNVPFPKDLSSLKEMSPIVIKHPYSIEYLHSYGQDSPFFGGHCQQEPPRDPLWPLPVHLRDPETSLRQLRQGNGLGRASPGGPRPHVHHGLLRQRGVFEGNPPPPDPRRLRRCGYPAPR